MKRLIIIMLLLLSWLFSWINTTQVYTGEVDQISGVPRVEEVIHVEVVNGEIVD